jgi:hypothetical protein
MDGQENPMDKFAVPAIVALLVVLFILTEIASAVLPLLIVIAFVPTGDRDALAQVVAACDTSRKLRIWPALRLAVALRRQEQQRARDPRLSPRGDLDLHFWLTAHGAPVINPPYGCAGPVDPGRSAPTPPARPGESATDGHPYA